MKETRECAEFHPTKEELIVLTKYWAERTREIQSQWGSVAAGHSSASARVERIMDVLGEDLLREIIREAEQTSCDKQHQREVPQQEVRSTS